MIELTREKSIGLLKNKYVKAALITALLIIAALFSNSYENYNAYYIRPIEYAIFFSFLGMVLPPGRHRLRILETVFVIALLTYFTYLEMEMWQGNNLGTPMDGEEMRKKRQLLNWALIAVFYVGGLALFKKPWKGLALVSTVFTLIGLASYAVLQFRGETLLPSDMGALQTAMDVAGSYSLRFGSCMTAALILYIAMMIWIWRLRAHARAGVRARNSLRLIGGLIVLFSLWLFYVTPTEKLFYPWFIPNNGYTFSVMVNFKMLQVKPDETYSVAGVEEAFEDVKGAPLLGNYDPNKSLASAFPAYKGKKPNIVCIMNESYADLSVLGDIYTDQAMMPNWKRLKGESISGDLVVEVFGGGTADSEYSFLTGNSTLLFADNARAYELYIDDQVSALPGILKEQGYSTYAVHPDKPENWNRENVYPKLGFEQFMTLDTFEGAEVIRDSYTSDRATYKRIENIIKNKGSKPAFIFDVTLQNHGAYSQSYNNLKPVKLLSPVGNFPQVEQYLSLVNESDRAFDELIDYFRKCDEPTVVLMFGDHLPKLEDSFYTSLLGGQFDQLSLEKQRERYTTPFLIWANYDIPVKEFDQISINYLSTLLTNVTGTEKTDYNRYLEELYQSYPVIDRRGVLTKSGEHLSYSKLTGKEKEDIATYKNIVYNNVLGEEEKQKKYFESDN